jgi:hypothetical protein
MRASLRLLDLVVAEVDRDLRYVWIDNPHPDFDPTTVIGKRDDELAPRADVRDLMALKQEVLQSGEPRHRIIGFHRSDGFRTYSMSAYPLRNAAEEIDGVFTLGFESIGGLFGLIPICAGCHAIRDEAGHWTRLEQFVEDRTESRFTHCICPECAHRLYPDVRLD